MNVRLRYSQKLQKVIDTILDDEERLTSLTCLYINSYLSIKELSLLYQTTEDIIIKGLKYENAYEYKVCVNCDKLFHISEFPNNNHGGGRVGRMSKCRTCRKPVLAKYRETSKDYRRDYDKLWQAKNKDHKQQYMKEYIKGYRIENYDKLRKKSKIYNENNKDKKQEYDKEYRTRLCVINKLDQIKLYEEYRIDPNNSDLFQVKCLYCDNWFNPTNGQIDNRLKAIGGTTRGEHRLYCSDRCKVECPIFGQQYYEKGKAPASSREVQPELRKLVFTRDNHTCQKCKISQNELEVGLQCHHIDPIINNPIESADVDNCITLCKDCHVETHRIPGCTYHELRCN